MLFKLSVAILATALVGQVNAHTRMWTIWDHSVDLDDSSSAVASFIRSPPSNSPVKDLHSATVMCNVNGATAVSKNFQAAAGDTLQPEWYHSFRGDDIIDPSHKGPIVAYLAPASSNGAGDVWVKISEEGYDGTNWATDRLIANKGKHSVKIPTALAPGEYIMRTEILALHEADTLYSQNSARGIQLYSSCSQLTVTAGGSTPLPAGVAFPGEYTDSTPGILFSVYNQAASSYMIPGPAVWNPASSAASVPTSTQAVSPSTKAVSPSTQAVSSSTKAISSTPIVVKTSAVATKAIPTTKASVPSEALTTSKSVVTPSSVPVVAQSSVVATTSTSSAQAATWTDYSGCMRAYNKCLDAAQPKNGGPAGFSHCTPCANTRRMVKEFKRTH